MLLLTLGLFFHFDIVNSDEIEKAYFNGPGHEAARNRNFMDSITDIMWNSTPGIDQATRITPHYSFLPSPSGHETYVRSPIGQALKGPSFTERFPQTNRRNRKITLQKINNRQLKNNALRDQLRHQLHQGTTVLEISQRRNPGSEAKASSYDLVRRPGEPALRRIKRSPTVGWLVSTAAKKRLYPNLLLSDGMEIKGDDTNTDEDDELEKTIPQMNAGERIMRLREITKKLWFLGQTETPTASPPTPEGSTARKFPRQNTVAHPYFKMIEALQEGYMMVFLIELTRLIATKERKAVRAVVKHTEHIIYGLRHSGQLLWFGEPLINVTRTVARLLKESETDDIQNHAAKLYHMLSQRHQELSVEVNTILEYADMLYDDNEGRLLFDALNEFAAYPNIRLTGYRICHSLIHNFLRPYRRLKDTQQRQELVDSVNLEIQSHKKSQQRSGDVRHAVGASEEIQPLPQTEPVTQTEPHSDTTQSPRANKRKQQHRSHKRKRERKRHRIHRHSQSYYQTHILGRMTQRMTVQSRFKVKMQKT